MLENWDSWTLGKVLTLLLTLGILMIWVQITVYHHRGKFHKWQMWIPVFALPFFALTSFLVVVFPYSWAGWLQTIMCSLIIGAGLYGGILHIRAIAGRTGGLQYENLQVGPPFVLPFTVAAFAVIQLFNLWY